MHRISYVSCKHVSYIYVCVPWMHQICTIRVTRIRRTGNQMFITCASKTIQEYVSKIKIHEICNLLNWRPKLQWKKSQLFTDRMLQATCCLSSTAFSTHSFTNSLRSDPWCTILKWQQLTQQGLKPVSLVLMTTENHGHVQICLFFWVNDVSYACVIILATSPRLPPEMSLNKRLIPPVSMKKA